MNEIISNHKEDKNPMDNVHRVFKSVPELKEWIEQTSLFNTISRFAGTGITIEGLPNGLELKLNGINRVEKAEDLPIEMIAEFYRNSPFMKNKMITK